jgi:SAM-dependent methyltransferase
MKREPRKRTGRRDVKRRAVQEAPKPVVEGSEASVEEEKAPAPKVPVKKSKEADPFLDEIYVKKRIDMDLDHRKYVGPKDKFEVVGKHQFEVMIESGLKASSSLLDIGCGAMRGGKFFLEFLDEGNYCGIDPNKALLRKGLFAEVEEEVARSKKPSFKHNDNFNLSIFDREFDFIVAQAIFAHAAEDQIVACLKSAHDVLAPGGKFVFNYFLGESDYAGKEWVYPCCTKYTELKMLEFVRKAGFDIESNVFKHPVGLVWIVARKQ